jgi:hypothetical protein
VPVYSLITDVPIRPQTPASTPSLRRDFAYLHVIALKRLAPIAERNEGADEMGYQRLPRPLRGGSRSMRKISASSVVKAHLERALLRSPLLGAWVHKEAGGPCVLRPSRGRPSPSPSTASASTVAVQPRGH